MIWRVGYQWQWCNIIHLVLWVTAPVRVWKMDCHHRGLLLDYANQHRHHHQSPSLLGCLVECFESRSGRTVDVVLIIIKNFHERPKQICSVTESSVSLPRESTHSLRPKLDLLTFRGFHRMQKWLSKGHHTDGVLSKHMALPNWARQCNVASQVLPGTPYPGLAFQTQITIRMQRGGWKGKLLKTSCHLTVEPLQRQTGASARALLHARLSKISRFTVVRS